MFWFLFESIFNKQLNLTEPCLMLSHKSNASVNSSCAQLPRASPRIFAFFTLWKAQGQGHLRCQIPGDGDQSRGKMPRPQNSAKFVASWKMYKCFLTQAILIIRVIVVDLKFPNVEA